MAHTFPTIVILSEDEKGIHVAHYGSFTTKWNDEPETTIGPKWSFFLFPLDEKDTILKEIERRNHPDWVFER